MFVLPGAMGASTAKAVVDPTGMVRVAKDSPEGRGEVSVSVSGQSVKVSIEVASIDRYESLLSVNGLNAKGEADEAAVAVIATGRLGGGMATAEDRARKRKTIFVLVVGGAALVLAAVGLAFLRRGAKHPQSRKGASGGASVARAGTADSAGGTPLRADVLGASGPGDLSCPVCYKRYPVGGSAFCPVDGARLVSAAKDGAAGAREPIGGICPVCGRGFESSVKVCPEHAELLVPAPLYNATASRGPVVEGKGKICPTCGTRYGGEADFCGKDGTALVLVN